jgi:hypothetical protein
MTAAVRKLVWIVAAMALGLATLAPSAGAGSAGGGQPKVDVKFEQLQGFNAPGTPAKYNKVGILKTGPSDAKNILVLVPGTSASPPPTSSRWRMPGSGDRVGGWRPP